MKRTVAIRIEEELISWFEDQFPMHGAKQWFFESCLRKARERHELGLWEAPVDLTTILVTEVTKDL
jgi:hypothetical protein